MQKAAEATPFSQLTYLLHLITSLNFDEDLRSSFNKESNDDVADLPGFTLLESIAAILVQRHEVMAVCYTSDEVSVVAANTDTIGPATDVDVDVPLPPSDSHTFHPLQFAALSNPDFSSSGNSTTKYNLHNVQIQTEGENLWTKVQGEPRGWYCAFMGPRPLRDHVATVSAYLNDCKSQTDPDIQRLNSTKFTSYLISTCWPKITRRILSWQAMGFMFLTQSFLDEALSIRGLDWPDFPTTIGPGDQTLIVFLKALDDNLKQNLIFDHCTGSTASHFPLIFNNVSSSSPTPTFSRETLQEFHKLTIAAFSGFASTFIQLKEKSDKMTPSERIPLVESDGMDLTERQTEVLMLLKRGTTHYRFLLYLICSSSFKNYFDMIGNFVLPVRRQKLLYIGYSRKFRSNTRHTTEDVEQIGQDVDYEVEADVQLEDEAPFEGEADMPSLFRFIKSFVIHLTAKRALERYCFMTKDQEVNISLFYVERSSLCIPAGSWAKMQDILTASFSSDPSSTSAGDIDTTAVTKAIEILRDKTRTPSRKFGPKSRRLLKNLQSVMQGSSIFFPGGMHCETVLATLGKHFELSLKGDDDANLISTSQKLLRSGMISVSKLCCPVCWELLSMLNEENPLKLRGHHSTIYPVELPQWLPSQIVDKMNALFQNHLRQEIEIMLQGAEEGATKRNRHVTHESESNISVASTNFSIDLEGYD